MGLGSRLVELLSLERREMVSRCGRGSVLPSWDESGGVL
jgi:hypothetical protein